MIGFPQGMPPPASCRYPTVALQQLFLPLHSVLPTIELPGAMQLAIRHHTVLHLLGQPAGAPYVP